MSKSEYIEILQKSFEDGIPFINYTEFYSYALIPKGGKWLEISFDFEDHEFLENHEITADEAYLNFCEEIEKAMSKEMELFYLNKWTEFKEGLTGSNEEKLRTLIKELTTNPDTYGKDFPVVLTQSDIEKVIQRL